MIRSYTLGPGTMTLDDGAMEANTQLSKLAVSWDENVKSTDPIPVLSGEELTVDDEVSYAAKITLTAVQDLEAAGLLAYSWEHMGETVNFTFTPNTAAGRQVTGTVRIVPLDLGGDMSTKNTSDVTWACPSIPVLGDAA